MTTLSSDRRAPRDEATPDFSLVLGGPLYQLLRRTRLSGDALTLLHRRVLAGVALTWVPLLVLAAWDGQAWWGPGEVPFLLDAEVQARFLVALPLLVVAELAVHVRMRQVVAQFVARDLVPREARPALDVAIGAATRLRNSIPAELLLVAAVYGLGLPLRGYIAVDANTWAWHAGQGAASLSPAGWWHTLVSLPLFQFLLLRWYFRLFIWTRFLWHVSRVSLRLVPTHPDRVGGLGFLANIVYAFAPLLLAHGALLAGLIADRIFFAGATLPQFLLEIVGGVSVLVLMVLCPLTVFAGQLADVKRTGLGEYGVFAQRYVREFDSKWLRHDAPGEREALLGSADIQSLADLNNSFDVIRGMRFVPFSRDTVVQLAAVTLAPLVPLLLTMISLEDLVKRLLSAVF